MLVYSQTELPNVDRVEVIVLQGYADETSDDIERLAGRPYHIIATSVEGELAQRIAELWRHLPMKGPQAKCHSPVFGLRFFSQTVLILEASLCYYCNNLLIMTNGERFLRAFKSDDTTYAQKLLKVMQKVTNKPGESAA